MNLLWLEDADVPQEITYRTPTASRRPEEEGSSVGPIEPVPIWNLIFAQDPSSQENNEVRLDLTQRVVRLCEKHFHNTDCHQQNFEALSEALYDEGRFVDAEEVDRLAIGLAEHFLTSEHHQTILLKANLACNLDSQGKYDETEALQVEALNSLSRSLPGDHDDILSLKSNLSETFRKQGKWKLAQDYSEEVVTTAVNILGCHHEHTLAYKFILATILRDRSQLEIARDILEEVAEAREKINGFYDAKTMRTYASLATVHQRLGCWQEATEMNNRLLHHLSEMDHPGTMFWTIEVYENLAQEMYSFDDYFKAERVYRELLEKKSALLTSRHPQILDAKLSIAKALYRQGKNREAAKIGRDVLSVVVEVLGHTHPFTLEAMSWVAWFDNGILPISSFETKIREVLNLRRSNLGKDHPQTLSSLRNVAWIESRKGNLTAAINICKFISKTLQRIYKTETHPALVHSYLGHASILYRHGDYYEATKLQQKAYNLAITFSNESHPRISEISCRLIYSLTSQRRYVEAENIASSAIWKLQGVLHKNHPRVLSLLEGRAFLRAMEGRYSEAETLRTQALNAILPYGDDHPAVIFARNNLAFTLSWQNKFVEADDMCQKVINALTLAIGNENAEIVDVMRRVAFLREGQRRYEEAVVLFKRILETTVSIQGDVGTVVDNMLDLASAQFFARQLEDSECSLVKAIEQSKKVLGGNHPTTLAAMERMANLKEEQGIWTEALLFRKEVVKRSEIAFGPHYYLTLRYHRDFANTLARIGDYDTSQKYLNKVFEETSSIFGLLHPDTVACLRNLAWIHWMQSDLPVAATLLHQAYEINSSILGNEHPNTVAIRMSLNEVLGSLQSGEEHEVVLQ